MLCVLHMLHQSGDTSLCVATKGSSLLLHTTRSWDHPAYDAGVLMLSCPAVFAVLRLQSATTGSGSSRGWVSTLANASDGPCRRPAHAGWFVHETQCKDTGGATPTATDCTPCWKQQGHDDTHQIISIKVCGMTGVAEKSGAGKELLDI